MKQTTLPALLLLALLAASAAGCSKELPDDRLASASATQTTTGSTSESQLAYILENSVPGQVLIKLKEGETGSLKPNAKGKAIMQSLPTPTQSALMSVGARSMIRLFPDVPGYTELVHKEGLDRWMIVIYDGDKTVPEAMQMLQASEAFEVVEPNLRKVHIGVGEAAPMTLAETDLTLRDPDQENPVNDPYLDRQWHYFNRGPKSGNTAVAGADINLFEAWKTQSGKRNVVVCIVDGGIDYTHEDLDGRVDLDRSFNFVIAEDGESYKGDHGIPVYPDEGGHGTHVAGTVGAINNNGIGVCGVAGGDGSEGSGVTLISAQVFGLNHEDTAPGSEGIYWGATHGAVISQNSWGYPYPGPGYLPRNDKEAIDFFVDYAGCDPKTGEQLPDSPMKGGVVNFAAGNDGLNFVAYPGSYERVIGVTSMSWSFKASVFTTHGEWADIMAPGGDQETYGIPGGVLSTVPAAQYNTPYAFMQGTSMACPHVSGVCALIVSEFGGPDFTADMLREKLLHSTRPYDINTLGSGNVKGNIEGRLGVGYIDAAVALRTNPKKGPEKPVLTMPEVGYYDADFAFKAVSNPNSGREGDVAHHYKVYFKEGKDLSADELMAEPMKAFVGGEDLPAGTDFGGRLRKLKDDTAYSVLVVAYDAFENGTPSDPVTFTTKLNLPPTVTEGLPENKIILLSIGEEQFTLNVNEPDGHKWDFKLTGDTRGVSIKKDGDKLNVTLQPYQPAEGDYTFVVTLSDEYGKESSYEITYSLVKYKAPAFTGSIEEMLIGINGGVVNLPLGDKVSYISVLPMTFSAKSADTRVLDVSVDGEALVLTPKAKGTSSISVTADDTVRQASTTFKVTVVSDTEATVMLLYPMPVKTKLNMMLHPSITKATVKISSIRGELLINKSVLPSADHMATLNVSSLSAGSYVLTVLADGREPFKTGFVKY